MYNWVKLALIALVSIYFIFFVLPRWESTLRELRDPKLEHEIIDLKIKITQLEAKAEEYKNISSNEEKNQENINKNYQNKIKTYKNATPDKKVDIFNNMYNSIDFKRAE